VSVLESANPNIMARKLVFFLCAAMLVMSFCLVEAKKKKNVRCLLPAAFSSTVHHAFMQSKSDVEKMKEACLQIVAISAGVVVLVEVANYLLSYRRPSFRATVTKLINAVRLFAASTACMPRNHCPLG
jgi:hypothetical protein